MVGAPGARCGVGVGVGVVPPVLVVGSARRGRASVGCWFGTGCCLGCCCWARVGGSSATEISKDKVMTGIRDVRVIAVSFIIL